MSLRFLRFFWARHAGKFGMATPPIEDRLRQSSPSEADRLGSWKEIAAYMRHALRTVQRWEEKQDLPIHRHTDQKNKGSVFAFKSEIDAWWGRYRDELAGEGQAAGETRPDITTKPVRERVRWWLIGGAAALLAAVAVASWNGRSGLSSRTLPDSQPSLRRVFELDSALFSVSPDGRWVAYREVSTSEIWLEDPQGRASPKQIGGRWVGGGLVWSRDSGRLAAMTVPQAPGQTSAVQIEIFDITTGGSEVVWKGDGRGRPPIPSDWTPDGLDLICVRGNGARDQWSLDEQVEIVALSLRDGSLTSIGRLSSAVHVSPAVSPNGRFVAYCACPENQCGIYLAAIDGSRQIRLTEHEAGGDHPVWSLDGRVVLFGSDRRHHEKGEIWAVEVDPNSGTRLGEPFYVAATGAPNWEPSLTREGDLWFGRRSREGRVFVLPVNAATGIAEGEPESPFSEGTHAPIWRGGGSKLAVVRRGRGALEVVERDLELGGERVVALAERWSSGYITPPPDGRPYAGRGFLEDGRQAIFVFRSDNGSVTHLYTLEGGLQPSPMRWSPDGNKLLLTEIVRWGRKKYSMNIKVIDRIGGDVRLVAKTLRPPYPIWSPDGSQIAFTDGDCIFVVPSDPGRVDVPSSETRKPVTCAALFESTSFVAGTQVIPTGDLTWSPDGSRLAWTINNQEERRIQIRIVDYATGTQTVSWSAAQDYESWPARLQWSPNGDQISFEMNYKRRFEIWALSGFLPGALSGG